MKGNINKLSIEEKVGQMLMVGMNTSNVKEKVKKFILEYKVGGIILYKKNYKNYKELIELVNYIKDLNCVNKTPLWIAIDQEGGRVNRLPKDFENLPSANKLSNYEKEDLVEKAGNITGRILNKVGVNFNFAPVLDVKRFEDNHAIGDRAFSDDIDKVTKYGVEYMKELQKQKVVSVIKHFPGHGATNKDTHYFLPKIKKSIKKLQKEDMKPFVQAIEEGADALLVSHLRINRGAGYLPTSMSRKFITKFIRKKYRFKGLIVTDDLRMRSVKNLYGKNKPIIKAFGAGNDIIVFKYNSENEKVIDKLVESVRNNKLIEARVNRSVNRILKMKEKYNISNEKIEVDENFINNINKEIMYIKNKIKGE